MTLIGAAVLYLKGLVFLSGCVVTSDDFSRVCVSLSCFLSELGCGAVTATLGLSIPHLSVQYGVPCADLGIVLTLSGLGYFAGVNICSKLLDKHSSWHVNIPIFWLVCISAYVGGLPCFALLYMNNLWAVKALVFIQVLHCAVCLVEKADVLHEIALG